MIITFSSAAGRSITIIVPKEIKRKAFEVIQYTTHFGDYTHHRIFGKHYKLKMHQENWILRIICFVGRERVTTGTDDRIQLIHKPEVHNFWLAYQSNSSHVATYSKFMDHKSHAYTIDQ